ncbi:hypothetical protein BGW80DRAFT_1313996 [Lactifluus volemus]|nr:hypothetical protein BGW80DRAFT_1313996 [Lactifluus volemus]
MVTGLSALTRLTQLCIKFERFETIRVRGPPPVTRVLLPILIEFEFFGVHEYLEVLLARIDAPQLKFITTRFFGNHVDIQHQQVMSHLLRLTHGPFERTDVRFSLNDVDIQLYRPNGSLPVKMMTVGFVDSEEALGQQILTVTQLALSLLSNITELEIGSQGNLDELDDVELVNLIDNPGWLVLFHTFTALRTLRLRNEIQPLVLFSLQGHTEVLPGLQDLYLCEWHWQGEPLQALEQFIAARQHSDHPVTVHHVPEYYDGDWEE